MTRSLLLALTAIAAAGAGQVQAQTARTPDIQAPDIQAPDIQAQDIQARNIQAAPVQEAYSHDPDRIVHSTGVRFADLDLASEAGRNALYVRIEAAADRVCQAPLALDADRAEREDYTTCRATTIAQTLTLVRGPQRAAMLTLAKRRAQDLAVLP